MWKKSLPFSRKVVLGDGGMAKLNLFKIYCIIEKRATKINSKKGLIYGWLLTTKTPGTQDSCEV